MLAVVVLHVRGARKEPDTDTHTASGSVVADIVMKGDNIRMRKEASDISTYGQRMLEGDRRGELEWNGCMKEREVR